jgi:hypothetical protein
MGYTSENPSIKAFIDKAHEKEDTQKAAIEALETGHVTRVRALAAELGAPLDEREARHFIDSYLARKPAVTAFFISSLADGARAAQIALMADSRKSSRIRSVADKWGYRLTPAEADFIRRTWHANTKNLSSEVQAFVRAACSDPERLQRAIQIVQVRSTDALVKQAQSWEVHLSLEGARLIIDYYNQILKFEDVLDIKKWVS